MPHTKRKGVVKRLPSPPTTSTPTQPRIERFFSGFSQNNQERDPLVELTGEAEASRGEEVSLSPPLLVFPPCPASKIALETTYSATGSVEEKTLPEGAVLSEETPGIEICSQRKPPEVNLGMIWTLLKKIEGTLQKTSGEVQTLNEKFDVMEKTVDTVKQEFAARTTKLEKDIEHLQDFKITTIKDNTDLRRKIEQIENYNRRLNLRVLNFPKLLGNSPLDLFKRYLKENLKIPTDAMPPINKIYYIENSRGEAGKTGTEGEGHIDLNNVSLLLEQSLENATKRATLLVSLVFEQDFNSIMRLYFKNAKSLFGGEQVWIYPDVTKQTQQKRKAFLALKKETLEVGGSFFLAYPSKCIVKLGLTKYVFFSPEQLKSFIEMRQLK